MSNGAWIVLLIVLILSPATSFASEQGIPETNEHLGFKLSPEALNNFELKSLRLTDNGPWKIPSTAVVRTGEEVNLFRKRDGFYKRIDFKTLHKTKDQITVLSNDAKAGDEIVVSGLGFLRTAELAAFGGVADSHSH